MTEPLPTNGAPSQSFHVRRRLHGDSGHDEARQAYLSVLNHHAEEQRHFTRVDRALTAYKTRQNLAVLALDTGDLVGAKQHWCEVVRAVPFDRDGSRGLSETMLRAGRLAELDSLSENLTSVAELRIEGLLMKSRVAKAQGALSVARESLDCALAERPDDWATLCERSRFLFEHGTTDEADEALRLLLERRPGYASAHHNHGIVLMEARRFDEAVEAYRQSLRYRPTYAGTYLNLGDALRETGRTNEAREAWEQAARGAPNDRTAREELSRLGQLRAFTDR